METIIHLIKDYGYYLFLGWIILYFVAQRKANVDRKKAVALIYQSLCFFALAIAAVFIDEEHLNPHLIWPPVAAVVFSALFFRKRFFPYPKHCQNCDATVDWKARWIEKNNNCSACRRDETTEEPT